MTGLKKVFSNILPPLLVLVVVILLWTLAIIIFEPKPFIFPGPDLVYKAFIDNSHLLRVAFLNTLGSAVIGIIGANILGIIAASFLSLSRLFEKALFPWFVVLQTTPIVAIAPLLALWTGPGKTSIILIAFIIGIFPILANTLMGLVSADKALIDLLKMQGASGWTIFYKIRVPSALPYYFTGLRISGGLGVIGAIVGEMVVGRGGPEAGLGYYVVFSSTQLKTSFLFSTIILSTVLGISFFAITYLLSWLVMRNWHESLIVVE